MPGVKCKRHKVLQGLTGQDIQELKQVESKDIEGCKGLKVKNSMQGVKCHDDNKYHKWFKVPEALVLAVVVPSPE